MTDTYNKLRKEILILSKELLDLIKIAKKISKLPDPGFSEWESICISSSKELEKNTIKIGIVGAIKSGKSTFTNCIFEKDYLKRGAGVITSIVTRVRNSSDDKAILFLKNWNEINTEIKQAVSLINPIQNSFKNCEINIRKQKDRTDLELALDNIKHKDFITNNTRNISLVLISSYLKGYDEMKKYIKSENINITFSKKDFFRHHNFIANDHLAIYLKDILLKIESIKPGKNIEIADCQGSDSPNPMHLTMIQNYLNISHLIIYIISTRTGIRQADIKFLSMIKRMGILSNIFFILNSDLNEYESIQELKKTVHDVTENLFIICQFSPQVFTFSALDHLIKLTNSSYINKESITNITKLKMLEFSNLQYVLFQKKLQKEINHRRSFLLTNNHIHKLIIVHGYFQNWIKFNKDILTKNTTSAKKIIDDMIISRIELLNAKKNIGGAIRGTISQVKRDLFLEIESFFGNNPNGLTKELTKFINKWNFDFDFINKNDTLGLNENLHKIIQEFRESINLHISEKINPDIIRFIHKQEDNLLKSIESISDPYFSLFNNTLEKYNIKISKLDFNLEKNKLYDSLSITNNLKLIKIPKNISQLVFQIKDYSSKIRTKAVISFSFNKILQTFLNFFGLTPQKHKTQLVLAKKMINYLKKETVKDITFNLKNYKENIKFQHISKISDLITKKLEEQISNHLSINTMKLEKLEKLIESRKIEKEKILNKLSILQEETMNIQRNIQKNIQLTEKLEKE